MVFSDFRCTKCKRDNKGERDGIGRDSSNNVRKRAGRFQVSGRFYSCFPTRGPLSSMSYFPSARLVLRREMLWHLDGIGPTMLPAFPRPPSDATYQT